MGALSELLGAGVTAAGGAAIASNLIDTGKNAQEQLGGYDPASESFTGLAGGLVDSTAFKPYTVTTNLGQGSVGADGSVDLGVGPNQQLQDGGLQNYGYGSGNMQSGAGMISGAEAGLGAGAGMQNSAYEMAMNNQSNPAYQQAMSAMGGGMNGLQGMQQGYQGAANQMMQNSLQDTAGRETDIFGRMMAAQQPGLDRQNAQMQARAHAQGRGGVAGSQYGGSGEQYAQSRAQMEAQNSAMLGAMGQAQSEMMNQGSLAGQYGQLGNATAGLQGQLGQSMGQLGQGQAALGQGAGALASSIGSAMDANAMQSGQLGGMLANIGNMQTNAGLQGYQGSFMPMQTQMDAMGLGLQNSNLAQTGQIAGANLAGQTTLGGIQTDVNAQKAASEVYGNMFGSLGNIISGSDTIDDWLSKIPGLGG